NEIGNAIGEGIATASGLSVAAGNATAAAQRLAAHVKPTHRQAEEASMAALRGSGLVGPDKADFAAFDDVVISSDPLPEGRLRGFHPEGATIDEAGNVSYKISEGDNLSMIAQGIGSTVEELAAYNNIENPDLIFAGQTLRKPPAGYQVPLVSATPSYIGDDGLRVGPTLERARAEGLISENPVSSLLDPIGTDGPQVGPPLERVREQGLPVETPGASVSDMLGIASTGVSFAQGGEKFTRAAVAQAKGFRVEQILDANGAPTGKVKIFGSQTANEVLGLPKTFRSANADNAKLIGAKGFDTSLNPLKNASKVGGVLTVVGTGLEVAEVTAKYNSGQLNDSQYAGELGNIGVKTAATTAATVGATALVVALGAGTIAAAPVVATVAVGIGIGVGVSYVYDEYLAPGVTKSISAVYDWLS
ncbi:LysM peptidoglycan-binding domain-containing protein, partial [Sedimenticola hydrogenitrophicus]|uniref:LysM peptidoglycan-binding domain-containing protein n=1 Tax=Sedimenticola hydrogenitrophicus TaxID=2967975 RepID=UPI0021A92EF0